MAGEGGEKGRKRVMIQVEEEAWGSEMRLLQCFRVIPAMMQPAMITQLLLAEDIQRRQGWQARQPPRIARRSDGTPGPTCAPHNAVPSDKQKRKMQAPSRIYRAVQIGIRRTGAAAAGQDSAVTDRSGSGRHWHYRQALLARLLENPIVDLEGLVGVWATERTENHQ